MLQKLWEEKIYRRDHCIKRDKGGSRINITRWIAQRKLETVFHNLQEINRTFFRGRKREIEREGILKEDQTVKGEEKWIWWDQENKREKQKHITKMNAPLETTAN